MVKKKKNAMPGANAGRRSLTTRPTPRGAGVVRICAGLWRKSPLLVADVAGLRPTPDRVRETLFDWVRHLFGDLGALRVLDLFAGSGVLGLEAASRGAARVDFVERNREAAALIRKNIEKFDAAERCVLHAGDAFSFLQETSLQFDLVLIDPPYENEWQVRAIEASLTRLAPNGVMYVETPDAFLATDVLDRNGLVRLRGGRAGVVHYQLLTRTTSPLAALAKPVKE